MLVCSFEGKMDVEICGTGTKTNRLEKAEEVSRLWCGRVRCCKATRKWANNVLKQAPSQRMVLIH
jgi:hypothetical protein